MKPIAALPLIGGNVALDFVNTAEERGHPAADDALRTAADLRAWGRRCGLVAPDAGAADETAELGRAIGLRELLYAMLLAHAERKPASATQLARLSAHTAQAYAAGTLTAAGDGSVAWRWPADDLASVRHSVAAAAAGLLLAGPALRLKQCPGDHCGWFFLDTTKPGNRRWCAMSECGQEAKSARRRGQVA